MPPFLIDRAIILKMIKVLKRFAVDPLLSFYQFYLKFSFKIKYFFRTTFFKVKTHFNMLKRLCAFLTEKN